MNQIRLSAVVRNILILNALFFLAKVVFESKGIDLDEYLACYYFGSDSFRPWQLITHMFMHGDLAHIFFNMYALIIFGPALESRLGSKRFLLFYLTCGIGALLLQQGVNYIEIQNLVNNITEKEYQFVLDYGYALVHDLPVTYSDPHILEKQSVVDLIISYNTGTLGASGAVFGILMGFGILFSEVRLRLLFPPVELKAKWLVVIYGAIELAMAYRNAPDDHVAHYAHLGGMLFAFVLIRYWQKRNEIY